MNFNDFILTDIEIKRIEGNTLAFIYVNFKSTRLPIVGNVSSDNSNFINFVSKRPVEKNLLISSVSCKIEMQEFFNDLAMIHYGLDKVDELNDDAILDAATFICAKHIQKVGRLIDTDLYTYIDLALIAKNGIWIKLFNIEITDDSATKLWVEIKLQLFERLKDFIFLSRIDMSNPSLPKTYLVKYLDE